MLIRSRSARFAAVALAVITSLVASFAAPAFAAGESTSATLTSPASGSATTFTWSYTFDQNGGKDLSNIAIGFCSLDILEDVAAASAGGSQVDIFLDRDVEGNHAGFGPGIKFHMPAEAGTFTVTFDSPHPIVEGSLRVQSHSGDGAQSDATTTADGPGPCPSDDDGDDDDGDGDGDDDDGDDDDGDGDDDDGDDDDGDDDDGDDGDGRDDDGDESTDISDPGPGTTTGGPSNQVLGVTVEKASNPAPAPATAPVVDSNTLGAGGELPRTGAGVQFLVTLALALLAAGVTLRATFTRRIRSASSPG